MYASVANNDEDDDNNNNDDDEEEALSGSHHSHANTSSLNAAAAATMAAPPRSSLTARRRRLLRCGGVYGYWFLGATLLAAVVGVGLYRSKDSGGLFSSGSFTASLLSGKKNAPDGAAVTTADDGGTAVACNAGIIQILLPFHGHVRPFRCLCPVESLGSERCQRRGTLVSSQPERL